MNNIKIPNKLFPLLFYLIKNNKLNFILYVFFAKILYNIFSFIVIPLIFKFLVDNISILNLQKAIILITVYALSNNIMFIIGYFEEYFHYLFLTKSIEKLRYQIFNHIIKRNNNYFDNNFAGSINKQISNIIEPLNRFFIQFITTIINGLFILISIIILSCIDYKIAIILSIWLPLPIFIFYKVSIYINKNTRMAEEKNNEFYGLLVDNLTNAVNIKNFTNEKHELEKLNKISKDYFNKMWKVYKERINFNVIDAICLFLLNISIMGITIFTYYNKEITTGTVLFIIILLKQIISYKTSIGGCLLIMFEDSATISNGLTILNDSKDIIINDSKNAKDLNIKTGKIELKNITFSYNKQN